MRLDKYLVMEKKTLSPLQIKKEMQSIIRMPDGTEKDNMAETLMGKIDTIREDILKSLRLMTPREIKIFDRAYEAFINSVGALADNLGDANKSMALYQKWINVSNGIRNKKI